VLVDLEVHRLQTTQRDSANGTLTKDHERIDVARTTRSAIGTHTFSVITLTSVFTRIREVHQVTSQQDTKALSQGADLTRRNRTLARVVPVRNKAVHRVEVVFEVKVTNTRKGSTNRLRTDLLGGRNHLVVLL